MTTITVKDIFDCYINPIENNKLINLALPLNTIELNTDNFDPGSIQQIINTIEVMNGYTTEHKKQDPTSMLLNTIDALQNNEDNDLFEQMKQAEKYRGNHIGLLNVFTATLTKNIIEYNEKGADVIVLDANNEPMAIARIVNRYSTLNKGAVDRIHKGFLDTVNNPESPYYNCQAIMVEKIPKYDGASRIFNPTHLKLPEDDRLLRMGLQQFMTHYAHDKYAYIKSLLITAKALNNIGKIPDDYDMRMIFSGLNQSINRID
jgi:hypothetical protein